MRRTSLSAVFIAAALVAAPSGFAQAGPAPAAPTSRVRQQVAAPPSTATADADRYAALEATSPTAAKFEGGSRVLIIGGSTVTLVLLVVLIVLLV